MYSNLDLHNFFQFGKNSYILGNDSLETSDIKYGESLHKRQKIYNLKCLLI